MNEETRCVMNTEWLKGALFSVLLAVLFAGCAAAPATVVPKTKAPQVVVAPDSMTLGVATVMGTPIIFKGRGFQPGDSVFIELLDVKKKDGVSSVPVADAEVDKNGEFTATVSTLVKVTELLRAKLGSNEKMETTIIVAQPTIPPGVYTVKAVSMEADAKAECKLTLMAPYSWDKFKDWVGVKKGKIIKK